MKALLLLLVCSVSAALLAPGRATRLYTASLVSPHCIDYVGHSDHIAVRNQPRVAHRPSDQLPLERPLAHTRSQAVARLHSWFAIMLQSFAACASALLLAVVATLRERPMTSDNTQCRAYSPTSPRMCCMFW